MCRHSIGRWIVATWWDSRRLRMLYSRRASPSAGWVRGLYRNLSILQTCISMEQAVLKYQHEKTTPTISISSGKHTWTYSYTAMPSYHAAGAAPATLTSPLDMDMWWRQQTSWTEQRIQCTQKCPADIRKSEMVIADEEVMGNERRRRQLTSLVSAGRP